MPMDLIHGRLKSRLLLALTLAVTALHCLIAQAALDPKRITDARSADDARKTLEYIKSELAPGDGIAGFNDLYLTTTTNIDRAIKAGRFENAAFMSEFTAEFANFYFSALRSHLEGRPDTPLAWQMMFKRGNRAEKYKTVQFAFTGMSAHIGRDLPIVLKALFAKRSEYPSISSTEYRDYLLVNDILGETFDQVENDLFKDMRPLLCEVLMRSAAESTALPSIKALRFKAWFDGKSLWRLNDHPVLSWSYVNGLDLGVASSNRAVFAIKKK